MSKPNGKAALITGASRGIGRGGTPRGIVERLHAKAMKAVGQPRMKELLSMNSAEPAPFTQAQFKKHVAKEVHDWGEVVRSGAEGRLNPYYRSC